MKINFVKIHRRLILFLLSCLSLISYSCSSETNNFLDELGIYKINDRDENLSTNSTYIVILGDIQEYTGTPNMTYYQQTLDWIYSQKTQGIDISCILQVGDITNSNSVYEWDTFYRSTKGLTDVVPFFYCLGNHDYDWNENGLIYDRNSSRINDYYDFKLSEANIVQRYEDNHNENIIAQIPINGRSIYLISLEFGPREDVVKWAENYVALNKDKQFILMTHEFLTRDGERDSEGRYAKLHFEPTGNSWTSPEYIWKNLVKIHNNIACVICGHNGIQAHLLSKNDFDRQVPQILFNLQYLENGGNGWIELWEIPHNSNNAFIKSYNTISRAFYLDIQDDLVFPIFY